MNCNVDGCGPAKRLIKGMCEKHYMRYRRHGNVHTLAYRYLTPDQPSAGWIDVKGYRMFRVNGSNIYEHRYVMQNHLGRELLDDENVHHINGDRSDNRLENLELWTTMQPSGKRVEDMIDYAVSILETYAPEKLT